MKPDQSLSSITSDVLATMSPLLQREQPEIVIVQGDTATVLATALAAFFQRIPVAHVEAGLRSHDIHNPFPEEMNRSVTSRLSALHFAPTQAAADNLIREGISKDRIFVTGNTAVDSIQWCLAQGESSHGSEITEALNWQGRNILLTTHRRESLGKPLEEILTGIKQLVAQFPDVQVIFPVHPNPAVRITAHAILGNVPRVRLIAPQPYPTFVHLMSKSELIITDSGGIQEEAPSLGKPVIVVRELSDRPESTSTGHARIVGASAERLLNEASRSLSSPNEWSSRLSTANPFGDGKASERIVQVLASLRTIPALNQ